MYERALSRALNYRGVLSFMRSYPPISGKIHYAARARKSARRVSQINFRRDVRVNDTTLVTSFVRGIQRDKIHALLREPFNFTIPFRHTGRRRRNVVHARPPLGDRRAFICRVLSTRRAVVVSPRSPAVQSSYPICLWVEFKTKEICELIARYVR